MLELGRALSQELTAARVRVEVPDRDTVLLRNVPTEGAGRLFNKPQTNLLVRRAREGLPFLVCVDEDLAYLGEDPALARVFAAGPARQGWRALCLGRGARCDFEAAVRQGLGVLGFGARQPALPARQPRCRRGSARRACWRSSGWTSPGSPARARRATTTCAPARSWAPASCSAR